MVRATASWASRWAWWQRVRLLLWIRLALMRRSIQLLGLIRMLRLL